MRPQRLATILCLPVFCLTVWALSPSAHAAGDLLAALPAVDADDAAVLDEGEEEFVISDEVDDGSDDAAGPEDGDADLVQDDEVDDGSLASIADCGNYPGTICLTENRDWTGRIWRQYPSQIVGCRNLSPDNFNDKASIALNNTDHSIGLRLYEHANCRGRSIYLAEQDVVFLWRLSPSFENKVSSLRVVYF